MRTYTENELADAVIARMDKVKDPRFKQILTGLVKHLHAFAREVELTEEEWFEGIKFLTAVGQKCDDKRQEFILLSDILGLSSLVDMINHRLPGGATASTVLGPFFVHGAPEFPYGADLTKEAKMKGEDTWVSGRVLSVDGKPLVVPADVFLNALERSAETQAAFALGYTELFSLITWTSVGLMGAAAAVAGQNLGAGHPDRSQQAVHIASRYGLSVAGVVGLFFLFLPRQLLGIFGMTDPVALEIGVQLLRVLSVSGLFITTALAYTGGLQGTGDTRSPLYISIISQIVVPLGICFVIRQTATLDAIDIWLAILAGHITRCALSVVRFNQGNWRHITVSIEESATH